jgi:hypothetical protein
MRRQLAELGKSDCQASDPMLHRPTLKAAARLGPKNPKMPGILVENIDGEEKLRPVCTSAMHPTVCSRN